MAGLWDLPSREDLTQGARQAGLLGLCLVIGNKPDMEFTSATGILISWNMGPFCIHAAVRPRRTLTSHRPCGKKQHL